MLETPSPGAGPQHGREPTKAADEALLARIIPLWIGKTQDGGVRPSLIFGNGEALISATTTNPCDGSWQLHLFSFSYEARQALQTIKLLYPGQPCEAAARPTGEGLLLIRTGDGPFECQIVDRRGSKDGSPPVGSWQFSHTVARQAALHIPRAAYGQARKAARQILSELNCPTEKAELCSLLGCKNRLDDRPFGQVRLEEVVAAANRLLEPTGLELTCSDRRILSFIDDYIAAAPFDMTGMVDRIANDLVSELADKGGIG
jgi:hypothetical protein